jgi:transmembrane sensor
VRVGRLQVRAVGTQFDVNRRSRSTVVTVIEGRVSVVAPSASAGDESPGEGLALSAGEQVTVNPAKSPEPWRPRAVNLAAVTAWTQRQLVFDASSLAEVVEEFNRYNTRRLVIVDPSLDQFSISGSFSSTNPASLLRFLEAQPGIVVTAADDEFRIAARN